MESPVSVGGHGGGLPLQGPGGRKEWRVVNESSGRERIVGDGSGSQARLSAAGRPRSSSGASRRPSRNGQMFHPSGSGHSSDSDHHGGDVGGAHLMGASVAPQELIPQSIGHGDEAVLYEEMHRAQQRNEHLDSGLSSMSMDSGLKSMENPDEALQQRLHEVSRQREQLQQAELELRAQFIARSEVLRMQNGLEEQSKQHSEVVSNLQGQMKEREQQVRHLEQQLEERERQLHVNQMETNEAVWAKDGLLREQTNELATLRRDRDSAVTEHQATAAQLDAERADHLAQLENLKEQVREKDRQLQEAEEQSRNTQDIVLFKDEQLRDAQAWMARAQELDAYHVNTNNTLHAELRDRTEQMNQLWVGYQRQMAELDRYHTQMIQRLQQEVADCREQIRILKGAPVSDRLDVKDDRPPGTESKEGGSLEANDDGGVKGNRILMAVSPSLNRAKTSVLANGNVLTNGNMDGLLPVLLPRDVLPPKVEHATGLPVVPAPLLGIPTVLPPPSVPNAGIPQFGMHQQGMPPPLQPSPLQVPQPPLAQLQPIAAVLAPQQHLSPLQHQQGALGLQVLHHHPHHPQQLQSPQVHRLSQRPQPLPLQQPLQPPQHLQPTSALQLQGQHTRQQELQQQEQIAHEQAITQAEQQNALLSQSSPLPPQQLSHSQTLQQQQAQQTIPAAVAEQTNVSSVSQQSRQEEQQVLLPDLQKQQQQAAEEKQEPEIAVHRQQNGQQERQPHEQRRRQDPRLQQFAHQQQPKQQQSQSHQHLQRESNDDPQPQQLQHQQGISNSMGHLTGSSHSTSIPQEDAASSHIPHEVSLSKSTSDNQDLQKSIAPVSKQQSYSEAGSKVAEPVLLDERSLLACLVRAVPAEPSARIRISSTLPNRLGKMLAPLHWHDYKKQFGRLDEFVGAHPELFVIEGDFINLREGAHATFSATTAVAKAAAAVAAATPLGPARMPTVAVTPVAQSPLQRGRTLKGSSTSLKESKGGPVSLQDTVGQSPSVPQTANTRQIQSPALTRNVVDNGGSMNLHHTNVNLGNTSKNGGKGEGQHIVSGAGTRLNGVSSATSNDNSVHFENGAINGYGASGRGSGYYGNRQQGRSSLAGSGQYRKQENHVRPQTQEGRIATSSSAPS